MPSAGGVVVAMLVVTSTVAPSAARIFFRQRAQPPPAGSLEDLGNRVVLGPEDVHARLAHRRKGTPAHSPADDGFDSASCQLSEVMIRAALAPTARTRDDVNAIRVGVDHHKERTAAKMVADPRCRS
jgi:hypothetical protein